MNAALITHCSVSDRNLYFLSVSRADLFPEVIPLPSQKFAVFLALDATGLVQIVISKIVRPLLQAGAVYFCCYGPDCERVHDIIDEELAQDALENDGEWSGIMTTWHSDEPLIDALWFFVFNSWPGDKYFDQCRAGLAISCGSSDWDQQIASDLKNLAENRVVFDESGTITGFEPR